MKDKLFLEKNKSLIDGVGIFTTKPIRRGEIFYVIPMDNVAGVPTPRFAHVGEGKYVNDDDVLNWINHSCDPNTILDISQNEPFLKSLRDISAGDEITCDYNQTEGGGTEVLCNCKSTKCKGKFLRIE